MPYWVELKRWFLDQLNQSQINLFNNMKKRDTTFEQSLNF